MTCLVNFNLLYDERKFHSDFSTKDEHPIKTYYEHCSQNSPLLHLTSAILYNITFTIFMASENNPLQLKHAVIDTVCMSEISLGISKLVEPAYTGFGNR